MKRTARFIGKTACRIALVEFSYRTLAVVLPTVAERIYLHVRPSTHEDDTDHTE